MLAKKLALLLVLVLMAASGWAQYQGRIEGKVNIAEATLDSFTKCIALKPDYADAYYQLGTLYIGQNKVKEAVENLEKFLALAPGHEKAGMAKQLLVYLKKQVEMS